MSFLCYIIVMNAGFDLFAAKEYFLGVNKRILAETGLCVEIPEGYEGQIRPRSGLALKYGVTVLNSPGTIDPSYRGEIKVILINHGEEDFHVKIGMRIAQLVVARYYPVNFQEVEELSPTSRGDGGFGSTGL